MFFNLLLTIFVSNLKFINMSEQEITVTENIIFYYFGYNGVKLYTPSADFAHNQAVKYGTEHVYVEKY